MPSDSDRDNNDKRLKKVVRRENIPRLAGGEFTGLLYVPELDVGCEVSSAV